MTDSQVTTNADNVFFAGGLDPQEVERLLVRIDENIGLRPLLAGNASSDRLPVDGLASLPAPAPIEDLGWLVEEIRRKQAPFFVAPGYSLASLFKKILNLPLIVFGRKQALFDREVLDLAGRLSVQATSQAAHLHALYAHTETLGGEVNRLRTTLARLSDLIEARSEHDQRAATYMDDMAALKVAVEHAQRRLDAHDTHLQGVDGWLNSMSVEQKGVNDWLGSMATNQRGLQDWIDVVSRKQQMLALDVREGLNVDKTVTVHKEARIVDPSAYETKLAQMNGHIKVNLGCGERPLAGYINVDSREVPDVDVVADIRTLPFEKGSLGEIASAHLVEHFREHEFRRKILPYWMSLLKPGGQIRVICPNWAAMMERLQAGKMTLEQFKLVTFGAQDYEGDDHFAMYTPNTLAKVLTDGGMTHIEIVETSRLNGICPEMELVGYS